MKLHVGQPTIIPASAQSDIKNHRIRDQQQRRLQQRKLHLEKRNTFAKLYYFVTMPLLHAFLITKKVCYQWTVGSTFEVNIEN